MRHLVAAGVALALAWFENPALAYVAEVTTSVSVSGVENPTQLNEAIHSAVDDVLTQAIAFTPTVVILTDARRVGDRLYLRLLIADQDGEKMLGELPGEPAAQKVDRPAVQLLQQATSPAVLPVL